MAGINLNEMPVFFYSLENFEFFLQIADALFGNSGALQNVFGSDAEVQGGVGCWDALQNPFRHRTAEVFDIHDGVEEISVGEEKLDTVSLQFLGEGSETEYVDRKENSSEEKRKGRRVGDGFFFAGDECSPAIHGECDFVRQRKLDRMKDGDLLAALFESRFEEFELGRFSRSVEAGKGDEFQ